MVVVPVSDTAPVDCRVLPWRMVAPDAVRQPRGVVEPTAPSNSTVPVPAVVIRQAGPSTVLEKTILPLLLVQVDISRTSTGPAWEILPPWVVIVPPRSTRPVPFWLKDPPPVRLMMLAAVLVKRPLLVTVMDPPNDAVMPALLVKACPTSEMPLIVFVSRAPCSRVVPVPLCWEIDAAVIALAVTLCALVIVKLPMRGPSIAPDKVISPAPAVRVRSNAPDTVSDIVIFPPCESSSRLLVRVSGENILISVPAPTLAGRGPPVMIFAPSDTVVATPLV